MLAVLYVLIEPLHGFRYDWVPDLPVRLTVRPASTAGCQICQYDCVSDLPVRLGVRPVGYDLVSVLCVRSGHGHAGGRQFVSAVFDVQQLDVLDDRTAGGLLLL